MSEYWSHQDTQKLASFLSWFIGVDFPHHLCFDGKSCLYVHAYVYVYTYVMLACLCPCLRTCYTVYSYMHINCRHFRACMSTHELTHMRTSVTVRLLMQMPAHMLCICKLSHAHACVITHTYHTLLRAPPLHACPLCMCACAGGASDGSQLRHATQQGPEAFVVGCLLSAAAAHCGRAAQAVSGVHPCDTVRACMYMHTPSM